MASLVGWLTRTVYSGGLHAQFFQIAYMDNHALDGESCQVAFMDSLCWMAYMDRHKMYIYSHSCLYPLSNERKSMFKSGDSRAV